MKRNNTNWKNYSILLLIIGAIFTIHFFIGEFYTYVLMIAIFCLLIGKLLFHLFPYFLKYMLVGKNSAYRKSVENPRILIYLIFGIVAYSSIKGNMISSVSNENIDVILSSIFIIVFSISSFLLVLTWTTFFEEVYIIRVQKKILSEENKQFHCNYQIEDLSKIYDSTSDSGFITLLVDDGGIDEKNIFMEIFTIGKIPDNTIFKLNMDHRQTKLYYDHFSKGFTGFTLDDFLNIFENKNGKTTREKLEPSSSNRNQKPDPKRKIDIDNIFIDL